MKTPAPDQENTYPLARWTAWPQEVDAMVDDFYERAGELPNALVASTATLRRMDIAAHRAHIGDADGTSPDDGEYAALGGMAGGDYTLTFLVNENVPDRHVWLVLEDGAPDGGEPLDEEERRAA